MARKRKRGNPKLRRLPEGPAPPAKVPKPVKEIVVTHMRREKKRNASGAFGGLLGSPIANRLLMAGGALAGGAATVVVAEKAGLSPAWAGALTGGGALAA